MLLKTKLMFVLCALVPQLIFLDLAGSTNSKPRSSPQKEVKECEGQGWLERGFMGAGDQETIDQANGRGIYEIAVRGLPSPPCFVAIEKWKHFRGNQTVKVAIVETRNQSDGNYQFRLSALRDTQGEDYPADASAIAQTKSDVQLGISGGEDSGEERPMLFDFARYEIAPDHFAFGVRCVFFESLGGAVNKTTYLRLFEISNGEIRQILKTIVSIEGGTKLIDGPIVALESSSTISVNRGMKNGHYILTKTSEKKSSDFVWSDSEKSYQLVEKDPQQTYDELSRKVRRQYGTWD